MTPVRLYVVAWAFALAYAARRALKVQAVNYRLRRVDRLIDAVNGREARRALAAVKRDCARWYSAEAAQLPPKVVRGPGICDGGWCSAVGNLRTMTASGATASVTMSLAQPVKNMTAHAAIAAVRSSNKVERSIRAS